jgi:GtrA-like protein.
MSTMGRFFVINAVSLGIDAIVSAAALWLGANLYAAPSAGVGASFVFAYVAHEFWTFRREDSGLSLRRFVNFALNCLMILLVRFLVIRLVENHINHESFLSQALILAIAAGVSFMVNFFISRRFIFT